MPHGKYPILNNAYQQLNASSPTHWHIAPPPSMLICIPSPWSGTWWTYRHHSWATGGCLWLQERIKITKLTHNITYHVLWVELTLICNTSSDRNLSWEGLGAQGCLKTLQLLFQCNLLRLTLEMPQMIEKRLEDAAWRQSLLKWQLVRHLTATILFVQA